MITTGDKTVYSLIQEKAEQHPNKIFLYYQDETITYEQLLYRVRQTGQLLKSKGVKKGDKIAILLNNCPEFYDLWFGCCAIGAVLVPINTASTPYEIKYFLEHSDSVGFFSENQLLTNAVKQLDAINRLSFVETVEDNWTETLNQFDSIALNEAIQYDDVCCMMYTSGTTSKPKGVEITNQNYIFAGETSIHYQWLKPSDRYLIFLPLFHANSQYYTTMASLTVGCSIVLQKKFSSSTFWDDVNKYKPTVSSFVATIIKMLLQNEAHPIERNHSLRQAGYGLFVTFNELEQFEERFGVKLFQWYGMTETITTSIVTPLHEKRIRDKHTGIVPIGKPALSHEVKIVDDYGNEVKPGEVGEIIVKSPSLMKGYYKNEQATADTIKDGWLYSGDNGYYNRNGYIWFVDRNKDMIKRAGENISSLEVENVIRDHPSIEDCAVIAAPDHLREETVVAYIKILDNKTLTKEDIDVFCKERLSYFKVPQLYLFIDEFPRTSIGKIQKNLLREMLE